MRLFEKVLVLRLKSVCVSTILWLYIIYRFPLYKRLFQLHHLVFLLQSRCFFFFFPINFDVIHLYFVFSLFRGNSLLNRCPCNFCSFIETNISGCLEVKYILEVWFDDKIRNRGYIFSRQRHLSYKSFENRSIPTVV